MGLVEQIAHRMRLPVTARGGLLLIAAEDAPAFLDGCARQRVRVLGIEGFHLEGNSVTPVMNALADFSTLDTAYSVEASIIDARRFLRSVHRPGMVFDFTVDREPR